MHAYAAGNAVEEAPHALPEAQAAALRAQMEALLREADAGRLPGSDDEDGAAAYGREMWARCEALTAGGPCLQTRLPPTVMWRAVR
jgi:midasin